MGSDFSGVTLVTTTGLRPEAFALCGHYVLRQTYREPMQWIVVDDGHPPMGLNTEAFNARGILVDHVYPKPTWLPGQNTLARNLLAAISQVRHEVVFFIEDDDWYAPQYLEAQLEHMGDAVIVGEHPAVYYNVARQLYLELHNNIHASLCQTGIRRCVLPVLQRLCQESPESVDIRLWANFGGIQRSLYQGQRSVGIKGMPGRAGLGTGHRPTESGLRWNYDTNWMFLRSRIGEDYLHYKAISTKEMEGEFEIFYWNGQKRYRCNQLWESGNPCGYDTFDYQDLLTHISQPHNRSGKRKVQKPLKVASPILDAHGEPMMREVREEFRSVEFKEE